MGSLDYSIKLMFNEYQVSSNKILAGAAFYGKSWNNVFNDKGSLFHPGRSGGSSGFNDLMQKGKDYEYHWDIKAMAPYLYSGNDSTFWSLDDPQSIALKSRYTDAYNLRGVFFWEISEDDINCTLLNSIFSRNMPDIVTGEYPKSPLPAVEITSPQKSDLISEATDLIIATNVNSSTKKVEFFGDNKSLGFDTKPPFNWVWFNIPKGNHSIKVVATNNNGKTKTQSVKIKVKKK